ncbi:MULTISPECIES: hypothetical protein [unclassified Dietzia]|uniref:hypothetical protein n=1 Tax=unclassified Dietzia TaxID=2617939 RepID=UPI000D213D71|nr:MULTISPECIES: hypothetical protein [unclassified Dietzia]AVZ38541.1 hypothetical protein CT688_02630 [Dietzia sp. JS16-p6b]QGW23603.1 integral membrane protein [Dietzia sp. DQ12-45-1b]
MPPETDTQPTAHAPARSLVAACAVVVVAVTALRTWVAAAGWFYWDDLILHGKAAAHRFPDAGLLLADHDGHLMPGGMALAWVAAHLAPLDFRLPLVQIAVLQLLAGAALARMLWVLLRGRPVLLLPLVAALAIPLGLPAATWWAAALNALPLTGAMAWCVASTVRLAETGHRRHAVSAVLATALGLLFVEKALLIPVVSAAVLVGWWWVGRSGSASPRAIWRRTRGAWAAQGVVLVVWAAIFVVVVGRLGGRGTFGEVEGTRPGFPALVDHTYRLAVIPTLGGGPWRWDRWHPGPPMADPPLAAVLLGALACAGVLAWSLATRRHTGPVWLAVALYPLLSVVLVAVGRAGPDTAAEIVQTLRYHAEMPLVLAAAAALALSAPRRGSAATVRLVMPAGAVALVALLASSAVSTHTYRQTWADQPSRDYALPLLEALRERGAPVFDQDLPLEVLLPVTAPAHRLSSVLAGVPGIPPVAGWTIDPVLVDALGTLHPAEVAALRTIPQGPEPGCGYRIGSDGARIPVDGPLIDRDWIVQLNLFADADGEVGVRLDEGSEVTAPVSAGLGTVFVRVEGGGTGLTVSPRGGVSELCIGSGPVGLLVPR